METKVERNFQLQFLFNLTFICMVNELVQFIQNIYFQVNEGALRLLVRRQ